MSLHQPSVFACTGVDTCMLRELVLSKLEGGSGSAGVDGSLWLKGSLPFFFGEFGLLRGCKHPGLGPLSAYSFRLSCPLL